MSEKLTYHLEGDYLIPDLIPPESPHIGIWGERRRRFLRTHQKPVYDAMLMNGTLTAHLEEVDQSAEEMMDRLTTQLAAHEGITESLKAADQMAWVQKMNSARKRSEEMVIHELIAVCCINTTPTTHKGALSIFKAPLFVSFDNYY